MDIDPYTHYLLISPLDQPQAPISRLDIDLPIRQMKLLNDILAILTDRDLRLVDVSLLGNPREVGRYTFVGAQGQARALKLTDNRAYAGIGRQLRVVDITEPTRPVETGVYNAPDDVLDIHVHSPVISLAVAEAGMINLFERESTPSFGFLPLISGALPSR